jgi:hypothetical protein
VFSRPISEASSTWWQEIAALAQGRLCRREVRRACRLENGDFADWACQACTEFLRPEAVSPWTWHLLFLYRLQKAGYPFRANDLSLETWLLLGRVQEVWENNSLTSRGSLGCPQPASKNRG